MTVGRLLALLLVVLGAVGASALFAIRLPDALTVRPPGPLVGVSPTPAGTPPAPSRRRAEPGIRRRDRTRGRNGARESPVGRAAIEGVRGGRDGVAAAASGRDAGTTSAHADRSGVGPQVFGVDVIVLVVLELVGGALGLATTALGLAVRRTRARCTRGYALYTLHLSQHDEAKPQDLEDLMEAIANLIRAFPTDRARSGQPFVAFELMHLPGPSGALEWSIGVRCEPTIAIALDGAISATYPDVRLGHVSGPQPEPDGADFGVPDHVMRFRKRRGLVYPLVAAGDELASPPIEAVAHAQASLGVPSVIRFGLTPAPVWCETLARRLYRRRENRLVRQERWGLPEGGLTSTLNRAEMANAERTQNRSLFWLELVVAAHDRETCRRLAAAVQARRGENRLHRRWMHVRRNLYRRRFPHATPPLVPSPRALISAAEAAHLLALPTARMKGVPVRRVALPRIPMPPEVFRAPAETPVSVPTAAAPEGTVEELFEVGA